MDAEDRSDWDGHILLLHSSERQRLAGVTTWMQRGLERGEKVVYVDGTDGDTEVLTAILGERGINMAAEVDRGRVEVFHQYRLRDPQAPAVLLARTRAEGFPALRVSLGPTAGWPPGAYRQLERNMARLCQTRHLSALCQCSRPATHGRRLRDVVALHSDGVREHSFATSSTGKNLVLRGELDIGNADVFGEVLLAAVRSGGHEVELDLSDVRFMDAAACRELVLSTQDFRSAGGRLALQAPRPTVARVLTLLGITVLPGFTVA